MLKFFKKKDHKLQENTFLEIIEKRWIASNIHVIRDLGFNLPHEYYDWLSSKNKHSAKCNLEGNETLDFWPLDEENFKYSSRIAGFLSITIGVFQSGAHVVIGLGGPPSKVMFIDNDGGGNKIYLIKSYKEFFSSLS